jgi:hypothetical protein
VLKAVTAELDVQQTATLAQVLESHRRVLENEQLERRIASLEGNQQNATAHERLARLEAAAAVSARARFGGSARPSICERLEAGLLKLGR